MKFFQGLSDHGNYHEFCRLIARLKSNYQLTELVKVDEYSKMIGMLTDFTVTSLQVLELFSQFVKCWCEGWNGLDASIRS